MDVSKILAELKAERAQIEEAILSLERLARGRGRGPAVRRTGWLTQSHTPNGGAGRRGARIRSSSRLRRANVALG